ncbi:uncharacterized protein LOC111065224 [Drosophila obscura]|uniref:uncharacterized protein LOC111065224 n=1 Tax=Drosophila obscura TaxID=7282 RepID=UPI001BB28972|nr:uncharacterized protein LOC111065224 [Drosophila obscura]
MNNEQRANAFDSRRNQSRLRALSLLGRSLSGRRPHVAGGLGSNLGRVQGGGAEVDDLDFEAAGGDSGVQPGVRASVLNNALIQLQSATRGQSARWMRSLMDQTHYTRGGFRSSWEPSQGEEAVASSTSENHEDSYDDVNENENQNQNANDLGDRMDQSAGQAPVAYMPAYSGRRGVSPGLMFAQGGIPTSKLDYITLVGFVLGYLASYILFLLCWFFGWLKEQMKLTRRRLLGHDNLLEFFDIEDESRHSIQTKLILAPLILFSILLYGLVNILHVAVKVVRSDVPRTVVDFVQAVAHSGLQGTIAGIRTGSKRFA